MRLIDADALVEAIKDYPYGFRGMIVCDIAKQTPIDPVKHGQWLLHEYPDGYYHTECSECGGFYDEKVYFWKTAHYCPNCGARMERSEDGET